MNYADLFRALCMFNLPYSWRLEVGTWMHESCVAPRRPQTEWRVSLLPHKVEGCIFIEADTPEELLSRFRSYVETGTIGGRELASVGDCNIAEVA